jgi:hypothetical protein
MINVSVINREAPIRFVHTAFAPDDWLAVFLKSYATGQTTQRVGPATWVASARFQAWLRSQNAARWNIYVSVNAVVPGQRTRRRAAIHSVRHVFLDADRDAQRVVAVIGERTDLPEPSYILASSPGRAHLFWRVTDFPVERVELLQKHLARQLDTDSAATPCSQMTRLPGFMNHKYVPPCLVTIDYRRTTRVFKPTDFPVPTKPGALRTSPDRARARSGDAYMRARRYLEALPPAIAGEHGDLHTFRVCCRLVRGFALSDHDAICLLADWNARCQPPWSDRELLDKLSRARQYGREPVGGLLEAQP